MEIETTKSLQNKGLRQNRKKNIFLIKMPYFTIFVSVFILKVSFDYQLLKPLFWKVFYQLLRHLIQTKK